MPRSSRAKAGHPISVKEFQKATGISDYHIGRCFPDGRWKKIKELAGLQRHRKTKTRSRTTS